MKINNIKTKLGLFLSILLIVGCTSKDSLDFTFPEAGFKMVTPTISNINLNFSLPDNPAFTVVWVDDVTGSSSYDIQMSTDKAFGSSTVLGSSSTKAFTMSVNDFDVALLSIGVNAFETATIYMRVSAGSTATDAVEFSVTSYADNPPLIESPDNSYEVVLTDVDPGAVAMTVTFSDPDFSGDLNNTLVSVLYELQVASTGSDFASPITLASGSDISEFTVSHGDLNDAALNLGLSPEVVATLDIRIKATIETASGDLIRYSDGVTITVTPYDVGLALSPWGVVGSAAPNGWDGPDTQFIQSSTDGIIVAFVKLIDGEIKFRENNGWDNNYGGANGTLEAGGANIAVVAGSYKIVVNLNDLTYSLEPYTWGIVGSAALNGWDGPDFPMVESSTPGVFVAYTVLSDGEIKFREKNDWTNNYGDDGPDGTLDPGGANIAVTAGTYKIVFNSNDLSYSIEPLLIWGVVGSAAPNGWDGPDVKLKLDYTSDGTVWYNKNVTLADGEIKFREDNSWDNNYGGVNGTLEPGGANIAVTAGSYYVTINLGDLTYKLTTN